MASLVRQNPKIAMLVVTAAATAFFSLPIWLPLLLITSPFLLLTSLISMGLMTLLKGFFHVSLSVQQNFTEGSNRRRLGVQYVRGSLEDVYGREEGSLRENRVQEYLEDQLKSLNVIALGRRGSAEDLPCSFSFSAADSQLETLNHGLFCQDEA